MVFAGNQLHWYNTK